MTTQSEIIAHTEKVSAHNYSPLPVVLSRGEGVWVWDVDGKKYLDCLSGYSSLNQGHRHPAIIDALVQQAGQLTMTSRAFYNDRMGPFLDRLCGLAGMDMALPMNTGMEAVETAIKIARRWAYRIKGVEADKAEIIVCEENFHGRTTTIISFSSELQYKDGFGPLTPGFKIIPFGDAAALEAAITPNTAAFMVEPIQGEAGINIPPEGFLAEARRICSEHNVLFIADEIQTGLARTGRMFCYQHDDGAKPDMLVVGKALGGGVYPVSATLASAEIMNVIQPGDHGSTFGGNPLAAAVADRALQVIVDEKLADRSRELGEYLLDRLRGIRSNKIREIRGRGLFVGIEVEPEAGLAREYCERLVDLGVLTKDTHKQVMRLAPPLVIEKAELDWLLERLESVF
ncbi:MAG: ornithine--oxo-acid transaminase [Alphaproteobacteria bacterium]|nr:ornithine--oxo-acid transaminase [Alphaproteobacteria bacterium]